MHEEVMRAAGAEKIADFEGISMETIL